MQMTQAHWPARDDGFTVEEVTVGELLRVAARDEPGRLALVTPSTRWTYAELAARAERMAHALAARHRKGERVAVWAANSPHWVVLELACALAGTVLVPLNPAFRRAEAEHQLRQSGATGLIHDVDVRGNAIGAMVHEMRAALPALRHAIAFDEWLGVADACDPSEALPAVEPGDAILMQYTSGTTGAPKGAVLHHRGLANKCRIAVSLMDLGPHPVWLNAMPMFHIGGCGLSTIGPLAMQGTQVMVERFDPALVLELVEAERATFLGGVPTMLLALMEHPDFESRDLSSLRSVLSGGSAVAPELVRTIEKRLGVRFMVAFGQTEGHGHICQTRPTDSPEDKAETVGQAIPFVELKIVDIATGATCAVGEPGELCARSPWVMLGYHDMPDATAATIDSEGFLHTGDVCTVDARGFVRFVGRTKEMIVRGGENIYPREIEDALHEHPAVADVAVVGVPDERYGEVVAAFVRLHGGAHAGEDELRDFVRARLAPFKCPRHWRFVDELPLTGSGKVQKFALRESFDRQPPPV